MYVKFATFFTDVTVFSALKIYGVRIVTFVPVYRPFACPVSRCHLHNLARPDSDLALV